MTDNINPVQSKQFTWSGEEWNEDLARRLAAEEDIQLTEDHWEIIRFLRAQFMRQGVAVSARILTSALNEEFADKGGAQYLFSLFPLGPAHQGCQIAGLPVPTNKVDLLFAMMR